MSALHNASDTARQSASNTRRTNTGTRTSTISRSSAQQSSNRKMSSGRQDFRKPAAKPAAPREKRYEIPRHFKMFGVYEPMPQSFEVLFTWDNEVRTSAYSYRLAKERLIAQCRSLGANGAINIHAVESQANGRYCRVAVYGTPVIFGVISQRGDFTSEGLLDHYLPNRPKTPEEIEAYRKKRIAEEKARKEQEEHRQIIRSFFKICIFLFMLIFLYNTFR